MLHILKRHKVYTYSIQTFFFVQIHEEIHDIFSTSNRRFPVEKGDFPSHIFIHCWDFPSQPTSWKSPQPQAASSESGAACGGPVGMSGWDFREVIGFSMSFSHHFWLVVWLTSFFLFSHMAWGGKNHPN